MSEKLMYLPAAAFAKSRACFQGFSGFSGSTSSDIVPAAVGLDRVLGYAECESDFTVADTPTTELGGFFFLAGRHFQCTSVRGNACQSLSGHSF